MATLQYIVNHIIRKINEDDECPSPTYRPSYDWSLALDRTNVPEDIIEQQEDYETYRDFILDNFYNAANDIIEEYSDIEIQNILNNEELNIPELIQEYYRKNHEIPTYYEIIMDKLLLKIQDFIDE